MNEVEVVRNAEQCAAAPLSQTAYVFLAVRDWQPVRVVIHGWEDSSAENTQKRECLRELLLKGTTREHGSFLFRMKLGVRKEAVHALHPLSHPSHACTASSHPSHALHPMHHVCIRIHHSHCIRIHHPHCTLIHPHPSSALQPMHPPPSSCIHHMHCTLSSCITCLWPPSGCKLAQGIR